VTRSDDMADEENWVGGFYELCLVLGQSDDSLVDRALPVLWGAAGVDGCWARTSDGTGLRQAQVSVAALHEHGHLRGTLALPSGVRVVCGSILFRYDNVDTLELYLPLGALARVDDRIGGFPFDEHSGAESLTWRAGLDRWLADIAIAVHAEVPCQRVVIGFEVDQESDVTADRRGAAFLIPMAGGLQYIPANA